MISKILISFFALLIGFHSYAWGIENPGITNFHPVTRNIYRGAQPTTEDFIELKKSGIKTVLDLRPFHFERAEVQKIGLQYKLIQMKPWHPEGEDVIRFLQIVTDENNLPVFIHCRHGSDRTGMLIAIYRITVCGWSKEKAIKEMTQEEFGFHPLWKNLIKYIRKLDIDQLREKAGISASPHSCE